MALDVGTQAEGVSGRQRSCARRSVGFALPLLAGTLLAATPLTRADAEPAVRGLMCRGGGGMTVDVVDRGGALIRLNRDIAPSMRSWLAPGECQWFESARTWRAQARYDALYYCCHAQIDRLTLLVDSGHPFRLWVYPDGTFSSVLVIESVGE